MSGHVFHPGHEELHGVTVVVESPAGVTWVGRYHERTERGVMLRDVATHDSAVAGLSREAWLSRIIKFGVQVDAKHLVVPTDQASRVVRLAEWVETSS
jgi:uncharacterized alpha-E superfamily protein